METYDWAFFTKKIAINSTISELYNAWTKPQELEKWFLSNAFFVNQSGEKVQKNENIKQNDSYEWSWYLYDITEKGKVLEANDIDLLQFTFAGNCVVEIRLTPIGESVLVSLTQSNIPTDDESKRGIRIGCDSGWSFFLVNLKSVYEGGIDLRNKDENLKGLLNN